MHKTLFSCGMSSHWPPNLQHVLRFSPQADIEKLQVEEKKMRSHACVLQRRCAVLAGEVLSYQDLILGKWDVFDMQSALLGPGYVAPVITTNPSVSRAGSQCTAGPHFQLQ